MSTKRPSDSVVDYYDRHASDFANRTVDLDMRELYQPFEQRLPSGSRLLDAGCGPGRDLDYFGGLGFHVVGFDASVAMVEIARKHSGREVHHLRFQDVSWESEFDGIWASASLLHVPEAEMLDVFLRLARALKPGGVWSLSFKLGDGERSEDGRRFTDYNAEKLERLLASVPTISEEKLWRSSDARPERSSEMWLNGILRKAAS